MRELDPAQLTLQEWQEWRKSPASLTDRNLHEMADRQKSRGEYEQKERSRRQALGWGDDPGGLYDGHYVDIILEEAEELSRDPKALTRLERYDLRYFGKLLTDSQRKQKEGLQHLILSL